MTQDEKLIWAAVFAAAYMGGNIDDPSERILTARDANYDADVAITAVRMVKDCGGITLALDIGAPEI